MKTPFVPISWGELIDKITILEIKARHITHEPATSNIEKELALLSAIAREVPDDPVLDQLRMKLSAVNASLWRIEDEIRLKDQRSDFGSKFIELARSIYRNNDARAKIKRNINDRLGSELVEEKSYKDFGGSA